MASATSTATTRERPTPRPRVGFFAYPLEKGYSSDQTARAGWTGIWSQFLDEGSESHCTRRTPEPTLTAERWFVRLLSQGPHARRHRTTRYGTAGRAAEGRDPGRPGAGRGLRPDPEMNPPAGPRTGEPPSARGTPQDAQGRLRPLPGERVSLPQRAVLRTDGHDRVVSGISLFEGICKKPRFRVARDVSAP
jgi:hypothetical protein